MLLPWKISIQNLSTDFCKGYSLYLLMIMIFSSLSDKFSTLLGLYNNEYFVLLKIRESLLAIHNSCIFLNSSFTVAKGFIIFLCPCRRLVSSVITVILNIMEDDDRSLI